MQLKLRSTHRQRYVATIPYSEKIFLTGFPQAGWNALHLAAQEGKIDVVRLLTEAEAHVNIHTEVTYICSNYVSTTLTQDRDIINAYSYFICIKSQVTHY